MQNQPQVRKITANQVAARTRPERRFCRSREMFRKGYRTRRAFVGVLRSIFRPSEPRQRRRTSPSLHLSLCSPSASGGGWGLISMQRSSVLTNQRTRWDKAGFIRTGAATHTHTQPTIPFTLIFSLLLFHSAVPRHTAQLWFNSPSAGSEGGRLGPANHRKLIITLLSDGSFPNDLHTHLNN